MQNRESDAFFGSDLWQSALEKYSSSVHLTVQLFNTDGCPAFGPVHPTPLFQLFDQAGYDPGLFAECAHRSLAQTGRRPAVLVSQSHGLSVVGASLMLEEHIIGAAVAGYALVDFSQVSEVQILARQANFDFESLWRIVRQEPPVPRQRLIVHGELLQALGDALLREHYRTRQYEQAAAIVNSSDDAIISEDLDGTITSWNSGAERMFGYAAREALGKRAVRLIHPNQRDEERGILERLLGGEKIEHYEAVRQGKDGRLVEVSFAASPIRDGNGRIVGASQIARDISERKRHEKQRELLIAELNHRVKNTLAVVQSLAMQTLLHAKDLNAGCDAFEARLIALANAHDVLTQEHWAGADLNNVAADAIAAYSGNSESRFHLAGPVVRLRPNAVLALSMALHELATNAVKYGALSNQAGSVEISWQLTLDVPRQFQLRWTEKGGPPVAIPARRGFGSHLIEQGVAHDLGGEARLSFAPDGIVWAIDAPLEDVGEAAWLNGQQLRAEPADREKYSSRA